jgi:hypothetical protein
MGAGHHKIRVQSVALEMIKANRVADLVPRHYAMTREQLLDAVTAIVQKDRLNLTDYAFRCKYVNYIRNYWNKS